MSLAVTPPHTLCLWQQCQRWEQRVIFTGLSCSLCLSRFDRGVSVDVSDVSCALEGEHGRQSMVEIRILGRQ